MTQQSGTPRRGPRSRSRMYAGALGALLGVIDIVLGFADHRAGFVISGALFIAGGAFYGLRRPLDVTGVSVADAKRRVRRGGYILLGIALLLVVAAAVPGTRDLYRPFLGLGAFFAFVAGSVFLTIGRNKTTPDEHPPETQ